MCNSIEKVFQLASATFSRKAPPESLTKHLETLVAHINKLTLTDVGLDSCSALKGSGNSPNSTMDSPGGSADRYSKHKAPVTYIPVTETMEISIGIFVIGEGEHIPLHDHPHMHGIVRCLSGTLKITSYTKKDPSLSASSINQPDRIRKSPQLLEKIRYGELFLAERLEPSLFLNPDSESAILEPKKANIHCIESVDGPAAFLDILAPPYNIDPTSYSPDTQERDCHYYRVLSEPGSTPTSKWLLISNPPANFYCDTELYKGPEIRHNL